MLDLDERLDIVAPGLVRARRDVGRPELSPGEARVDIRHLSLCGSDYKLFTGAYGGPCAYPLAFGHEWAGTVREVRDGSGRIRPGDVVTGDCSRWGEDGCPPCS